MGIKLTVDRPYVLRLEDAFAYFQEKTGNVEMMAQLAGSENWSVKIPYIDNKEFVVYPINFLNIVLSRGRISGYFWTNSCAGCSQNAAYCYKSSLLSVMADGKEGKYEQSNCSRPKCDAQNLKKCDPRIFITWSGTDFNGKYLTSAGKALDRFRDQDIQSLYNSMDHADIQ
jgi:hypothetical protein